MAFPLGRGLKIVRLFVVLEEELAHGRLRGFKGVPCGTHRVFWGGDPAQSHLTEGERGG